jgi:hypothetical protein
MDRACITLEREHKMRAYKFTVGKQKRTETTRKNRE